MLDLLLLEQLVVNVENRAARITEDVLDAFFLQAADDDLCARKLHGYPASSDNEHVCPAPLSRVGVCKTRRARVSRSLQGFFGLKAAIIAASAASHRVAPAALVARPEGTPRPFLQHSTNSRRIRWSTLPASSPLVKPARRINSGPLRHAGGLPAGRRGASLAGDAGRSRRASIIAGTRRPEDSNRFASGTLGLSRGGRAPRIQAGALRRARRRCGGRHRTRRDAQADREIRHQAGAGTADAVSAHPAEHHSRPFPAPEGALDVDDTAF